MQPGSSSPITSKPSSPHPQGEFPVLNSYLPPPKQLNTWGRVREYIREPMAEFIGVAVFCIFGTGAACQVLLSGDPAIASSPKGEYLSTNFGWGIGLALGAWVNGGISGAHLNPAITLALATYRGFPWRKVPGYIFAQVSGGVIGAGLVYANYYHAITIFEGGSGIRTRATAGCFATYALDYVTPATCFFCEFLGTVILALLVIAGTDKKNNAPPPYLTPLILFFVLFGLGGALGMQTAYAFNPARDFGPRLFLTMAGYGGQLYSYRSQYWLWCPIIAPILGAQASMGLYMLFLDENTVNEPAPRDERTRDVPGSA